MSAYGLTRDQNVELLVKTALEYGITDRRQIAYIVATAQHETDNFNTSREYDGPNQARIRGYDGGENYYGRGYVQVTHDGNYDKMATALGDPRIRTNPDIVAQESTLGAQTTVVGMARGIYTGVGLDRYINSQGSDYTDARAIVNGTDRADHIAGLARTWEQNLPGIIDRVSAQGITPRAMPGSPMADGSLSVNESGPEVARMQEALRQRGFQVTPDGIYGNGTRGIVEQYQRQNGLSATGTADRETLSSLGVTQIVPLPNAAAPAPNAPAPNTPTPPAAPSTPGTTPADPMADNVLRRGEEGAAVTRLQESLTKAGFSTQGADGKFGQNTEDAVKLYQASRGLGVDGIAGPATLKAISDNQPAQQQAPPTGTPAPTQPGTAPNPSNDPNWPAPGNFTVNRVDKDGEGDGEFGSPRGSANNPRIHKGIDINGREGDPIEPMRAGRVTFAGDGGAGAGNMIIVDHGGGFETRYLHLKDINVRQGQQVTENTQIATMGRTGNTPGDTHLHFETRENGVAVDPRNYLNFPPRELLQQGDGGKDVSRLQEALVRNGATIKPDGDFGPGTKAAVEAFQRSNNLTPDGIAGPATQRALGVTHDQTQTAPSTPTTPAPSVPTTPTAPTQSGALADNVLRRGEEGPEVKKLQEDLTKAGFSTQGADGKFGPNTEDAVKRYQDSRGLQSDGIAGPATLAALSAQQQAPAQPAATTAATQPQTAPSTDNATQAPANAQPTAPQQPAAQPTAPQQPVAQEPASQQTAPQQPASQQSAPPQAAAPEPSGQQQGGGLKPGDTGPAVAELQQKLAEHGGRCGCGTHGVTPDGNYGKMTELAVQDFQRGNNLPATGVADEKTLAALGIKPQQQAPTAAGDTPQTPTAQTPTAQTAPTATDKPQTPATGNDQVQPPTQTDRPLISNPSHPDNKLYQQAVSNLEQLGPSGGFKSREELEKAAASVAADAKATGLQSIDHISKTNAPNGQSYLVAVQGDPTNPASKNAFVDYNQATSQTVQQSTAMTEGQKPAAQQPQAPAAQQQSDQPEPTRLAVGAR